MAEEQKMAKKKELAADLKTVNDAANDYFKVVADNKKQVEGLEKSLNEKADKAYDAYKKALNDFSDKHNGYHLTYRTDGNNVEFKVVELHTDELEQRINREIER